MKRRLVKLVVFLVLGAVVNVAVAWGCIFKLEQAVASGNAQENPMGMRRVAALQAIADRVLSDPVMVPGLWIGDEGFGATLDEIIDLGSFDAASPKRSRAFFAQFAAGWPLNSLQGWAYGRRPSEPEDISLLRIQTSPVDHSRQFLPIAPSWPGFAINTVFYSGACWLLLAAPLALRRRRRIKRGLCPRCKYPVGTSPVCTECGKPVKPKPAEAAA